MNMKKYAGIVSILLCLTVMAVSASALEHQKVTPVPYGYSDPSSGCGSYTGAGYPGCGYPGGYPSGGSSGGYPGGGYPGGYPGRGYAYNYGCGAVDPSRYPGSTEYCTRWIPGHWIQAKVMVPGRWVYRPVWIPAQPRMQYKWIKGFWQTSAYHTRPDVYVWRSQTGGVYGVPYQTYQQSGGGYFTPGGVWVPNAKSRQK